MTLLASTLAISLLLYCLCSFSILGVWPKLDDVTSKHEGQLGGGAGILAAQDRCWVERAIKVADLVWGWIMQT